MVEPSPDRETNDEPPDPDSSEPPAGRAGWQRLVWVVGILMLLGLAVLLATGDHGPGRHRPADAPGQEADAEGPEGHDPSRWNH